jgi:hypothetical protein
VPSRAAVPRAAAPAVRPSFTVEAELGPGSRLLDDLLLAPFLTTRDLLSLSATATWLRPYRSLLRDIKVKTCRDGVAPAVLRGQRHLHTLHVGAADVLGRLAVSLRGGWRASPGVTLRRVILAWDEAPVPHDEGVDKFSRWLRTGRPLLEELDMSRAKLERFDTASLFVGLHEGCPELRCLKTPRGGTGVLAVGLRRGMCPRIQHLVVTSLGTRDYSRSRLAEALRACPRPALRDLHLISMEVGPAYGDALRSGACPGLRVLRLKFPSFVEGGAVALLEALEATGLGPQGAQALT